MPDSPLNLIRSRVSVVLIFFNSERFIAEAIESVLAQTHKDWELILVDDGSADCSSRIARDYAAHDSRIRYVDHPNHENRGMSASRNLGAKVSNAPFISFIDSDDFWEPGKLSEQLEILQSSPGLAMVCGALRYWYSWDPLCQAKDQVVLTGNMADRLLTPPEGILALYPLGPGPGAGLDILVQRNIYEKVGGFEERFRGMYEDQAFLSKIFLDYPTFISSRPWLKYRQHPESCCATSSLSSGGYEQRRLEFLQWFEEYLDCRPASDPVVRTRLRSAQRDLRLAPLRNALRRGRSLIKFSISSFLRT